MISWPSALSQWQPYSTSPPWISAACSGFICLRLLGTSHLQVPPASAWGLSTIQKLIPCAFCASPQKGLPQNLRSPQFLRQTSSRTLCGGSTQSPPEMEYPSSSRALKSMFHSMHPPTGRKSGSQALVDTTMTRTSFSPPPPHQNGPTYPLQIWNSLFMGVGSGHRPHRQPGLLLSPQQWQISRKSQTTHVKVALHTTDPEAISTYLRLDLHHGEHTH